jgi:hypothetical protein
MRRSLSTFFQFLFVFLQVTALFAYASDSETPTPTSTTSKDDASDNEGSDASPYDFLPLKVSGSTHVHDPGVVKTPDDTYILLSTGKGLPIRTSTDRIVSDGFPFFLLSTLYHLTELCVNKLKKNRIGSMLVRCFQMVRQTPPTGSQTR